VVSSLKNQSQTAPGWRGFGLRNGLVVVQVALSLVLLAGASLFLRSLQNAASIDTGMRGDGVLLMAFDPKLNGYSPERSKRLLATLRERVEAMPGVQSVSYLDSIPLSIGGTSFDFSVDEKVKVNADVYYVGARFFETMGIALRKGREFDVQADRDGRVAVINETMAHQAFGDSDPMGREIRAEKQSYRVIGVAKNSKSRTLAEDPKGVAYLFLEAQPDKVMSFYGTSIAVKAPGGQAALLPAIRRQILALDPNLAVFNAQTMRAHLDKALMLPRLCATLLGVFGAAGLILAAIGLYGVMSYAVRSRTKEIGIRIALGAERSGVLRLVLGQGMAVAGTGLLIGLALAWSGSRYLASWLYGLSPTDLFTFTVVPGVLLAVAMVAVVLPARRAASVDPLIALRYE
jgi:predicted permease